MAEERVKTHQVISALRNRYDTSKGAWVHASEVSNQTGFDANRRCDFMAVGCWKSVGLELHGMEVKVNRNDWQKEMQDITKAEAFAQHCHRWWLVFANKCAKLEEVPLDWGVMEYTGTGLKVRRQPTKRTPDLHWPFLVSLLRGVSATYSSAETLKHERKKAYDEGVAYAKSIAKPVNHLESKYKEAVEELAKLKKELGFGTYTDSRDMLKSIRAAIAYLKSGEGYWQANASRNLEVRIEQLQKAAAIVNSVSMGIE